MIDNLKLGDTVCYIPPHLVIGGVSSTVMDSITDDDIGVVVDIIEVGGIGKWVRVQYRKGGIQMTSMNHLYPYPTQKPREDIEYLFP